MPQQGVANRHKARRRRQEVLGDPNLPPIRTKQTKEAFSLEIRRAAIVIWLRGEWTSPLPTFVRSTKTLRRYFRRAGWLGHIRQFKRNGGQQRRVLAGVELLHIAAYRAAFRTTMASI